MALQMGIKGKLGDYLQIRHLFMKYSTGHQALLPNTYPEGARNGGKDRAGRDEDRETAR